ncbi:hypothetical protein AVEN_250127-1 [Araneus ventricosus]|uniref:Reverse transcriptase/retrotransposon-derived protein RNase H-like domain-containing protein n=1 Tax=Araneus ventricosus TaxID=182803 RepID=A0A4Y2SPV0_ARAVE|nr:hypothetical protein AVEN_237077-1 [Araneus ventricosus]GBN89904.1 hypothetical protein AVEN_250127-1 [Araneus ventricosus]
MNYPWTDTDFILDTDASNKRMGALPSQKIGNKERVIACFSKRLGNPEINYCVKLGTEKKHYIKKVRPKRQFLIPCVKNEENEPLVASEKILLPPLQINLGLMNFVKAMDCGGSGFQYLSLKFLKVSESKIKESIFVGPQFRQLMKDLVFESKLTKKEAAAWTSFKEL